jgi:hypothetical protein
VVFACAEVRLGSDERRPLVEADAVLYLLDSPARGTPLSTAD